ncbi:uncharacterized protein KGF55_003050 [Candida pseudojiufengensis]|uniref:uncharacterized protein n=1 Tax=Candida pseudojiufengensis TaxID=497109 RepID=UPI0022249D5C|nr:uncharacterized protein KGF55_003050 [Candida pseudojiufengensis]KAI5963258.1 hypothetical protein KGF55_003050 [Candida pseudojiufengensis]
MENLNNIKIFLKSLDNATSQYESSLTPILSKSIDEQLATITNPKDKINFLNHYQYILVSTIYSYLKVLGVDADQHPIKKELNRVQSYMARYNQLNNQTKIEEKSNSSPSESTKEYLQKTLGIKNGNENTVVNNGTAISTQNFSGKHTKFEDDKIESDDEKDINREVNNNTTKLKTKKPSSLPNKPSKGKVTKPVTNKKNKTNKFQKKNK